MWDIFVCLRNISSLCFSFDSFSFINFKQEVVRVENLASIWEGIASYFLGRKVFVLHKFLLLVYLVGDNLKIDDHHLS